MSNTNGPERLKSLCDAITYLQAEATRLTVEHDGAITPESLAAKQQSSYQHPAAVYNASCLAVPLIESGAEHLSVLAKSLIEPIEVIATLTTVRSMLEPCALAAWLLDPTIGAHARVSRVFALRYEGMDQQLRFAKAMNRPEVEIQDLEKRIDSVEKQAVSFGFQALKNKKNHKRYGIAERMPSATELINDALEAGGMYRLLSAVAHGHNWAIRRLCYEPQEQDDNLIVGVPAKAFAKTASARQLTLLTAFAVRAFICPVWNQCRYFGWNALHFEEVFENAADRLRISTDWRFWRCKIASDADEKDSPVADSP